MKYTVSIEVDLPRERVVQLARRSSQLPEVAAWLDGARADQWGAGGGRHQVAGDPPDGPTEVRGHRDRHAAGAGGPTPDPDGVRRSVRPRDRRGGHVERRARPLHRSRSGEDALGE